MSGYLTFLITESAAKYIVFIALILALGKKTKLILEYMGIDTIAPEIVLKGLATMEHERGTALTDPGVVSPDMTATFETTGSVDIDAVGEYTLSYVAVDKSGNRSETLTRSVTVSDTTAPIVTLIGSKVMHVLQNDETFVDPGVEVDDDTATVETTNAADVSAPGTYVVSYSATDPYGNASNTVTRMVHVVEEMPTPSHVLYYAAALAILVASIVLLQRRRNREASVVDAL